MEDTDSANIAINKQANVLDNFFQNEIAIKSWADHCCSESYYDVDPINSEDRYFGSFITDTEKSGGWNRVQSKSKKEARNKKISLDNGFQQNRYSKYQSARYCDVKNSYQLKYNHNKPNGFNYNCDVSPKSCTSIGDCQSPSDSGEADIRQSANDSKEQPEFVDAPVPKVNPWSKLKESVMEEVEHVELTEENSNASQRTEKTSSKCLAPACDWGRSSCDSSPQNSVQG